MQIKQVKITCTILLVTLIIGYSLTQYKLSIRKQRRINSDLENLVAELVENDSTIKNCVLAILKGDSSYSWSGAAGISNQEYQTTLDHETPYYIASITKLYTSTAIMKLYEDGIISLDDPISKYLPKDLYKGLHIYKMKDYSQEITIKQLLAHTSGIADYYTEKPVGGESLFEKFLKEPGRSWTAYETIEWAKKELKPNFLPGTNVSYSDTNYQLLGILIEIVTGKSLQNVYEEFFFEPLGLKHTWLSGIAESKQHTSTIPADVFYNNKIINDIRSNGSYWADGGIISTAEESIIFLKALNDGKIVRKTTLKLMHNWNKLEFPFKYGYGTMFFELPANRKIPSLWGHSGSTGSFLYYSEELDLYMAGTINQVEAKPQSFKLMIATMKLIQLQK